MADPPAGDAGAVMDALVVETAAELGAAGVDGLVEAPVHAATARTIPVAPTVSHLWTVRRSSRPAAAPDMLHLARVGVAHATPSRDRIYGGG